MKRKSPGSARDARTTREIGWREHVGLPELGIDSMRAKIDTGARTSALHATGVEEFERDGSPWVRFGIPLTGKKRVMLCEAPLAHQRHIKNTGGSSEERPIIDTMIVLGQRRWVIEVSLTNRDNMEFDLIVGRTAIRRYRMVVNPCRSFLAGLPACPLPAVTARD